MRRLWWMADEMEKGEEEGDDEDVGLLAEERGREEK